MFDLSPYHDDFERLFRAFGVEELALFGSALREDFGAASDLDFAVRFNAVRFNAVRFNAWEPVAYKRAHFGLQEGLERLLGRHVDLLSLDAVENPGESRGYQDPSMPLRDKRSYLWDILDAAKAVLAFTEGKDFADYRADRVLRRTVERGPS